MYRFIPAAAAGIWLPLCHWLFLGILESMAYEVTATRRRPQRFEDLVGQEFVAETFRNSIGSGKIAHAYLFSGPRGCGKTSTARILAKALNCEKGPTATPCGQCSACREITAGSSLDVIEIDGASNTSVNDVRQIKDEVLFPPNSCRYKVYIIDEVHMLSTSAFNALLKTIEEPPPYVVFVFATTELQKVPATIKSRCQQFNFRLVPIEKVKEQLALAAKDINIQAEDEALYWIARESTGSMRDAYTLFDQVAAFSGDAITYEKIRDKLGLVGVDRLNELFTLCVQGKRDAVLLALDSYLQNGVSIEQLISTCSDYLRNLLLIKSGISKESLLGQSPDRYAPLVLESWNSIQIERAIDIFLKLYRDIRYSLSPRYEMELALSRLCWLKDYVSATDVKKAIDAVRPVVERASGARAIAADSGQEPSRPFADGGARPQENESPLSHFSEFLASRAASGSDAVRHPDAVVSELVPEPVVAPSPVVERPLEPVRQPVPVAPVAEVPDAVKVTPEPVSEAPVVLGNDAEPVHEELAATEEPSEPAAEENVAYAEEDVSEPEGEYAVPPETMEPETTASVAEQSAPVPGPAIDTSNIETVFSALMEELNAVGEGLIAGVLAKSEKRSVQGNTVQAVIHSQFELMELRQQASKITQYLSRLYGKQMSFEVVFEETVSAVTQKELPLEVQILRDTFKGTVIVS